jgi:hypothetical protein
VDDLVAAWQAQRPDLDVEPLQVLSRHCAARALPTSSARGHYSASRW